MMTIRTFVGAALLCLGAIEAAAQGLPETPAELPGVR